MSADIDELAEKINKLIDLVRQLRHEKIELINELTQANQHNIVLTEKLNLVQQRIDNLLQLLSINSEEENLA